MTITSKDLKHNNPEDNQDKDTVSKAKVEKPMPVHEITESPKPLPGVKNWIISLVGPQTYTHPLTRRVFTKGVAVYTSNEALAEECKANGYFTVSEA